MAELHDLTALEQGALVRRGEVSSLELTEHYLDRAARLDDVGAFEVVLRQLERRHLAAAHQVALLERGQVMEFGHDPTLARRVVGQAATDSRS